MFNWTIINDVPRGITNSTGAVGTEVITMSPVMTETTLVPKTSGGGVTWSGQVAMGTGVRGAVLLIVAETMALKALSQRTSRSGSKCVRVREYSSGGRENVSAVRESNMLSDISGNREGTIVRIGQVIVRICGVYCSGR